MLKLDPVTVDQMTDWDYDFEDDFEEYIYGNLLTDGMGGPPPPMAIPMAAMAPGASMMMEKAVLT